VTYTGAPLEVGITSRAIPNTVVEIIEGQPVDSHSPVASQP
jgi:hypothetical protein